jgi:hypothetical protein
VNIFYKNSKGNKMTKKMIDASALYLLAEKKFRLEPKFGKSVSEYHQTFSLVDLENLIDELATPAPEPQKQEIIDFYIAFKDTIEAELVKKLEDSLVGITADNAYIGGLQMALRLADESAKYVIDKLRELPTGGNE